MVYDVLLRQKLSYISRQKQRQRLLFIIETKIRVSSGSFKLRPRRKNTNFHKEDNLSAFSLLKISKTDFYHLKLKWTTDRGRSC